MNNFSDIFGKRFAKRVNLETDKVLAKYQVKNKYNILIIYDYKMVKFCGV